MLVAHELAELVGMSTRNTRRSLVSLGGRVVTRRRLAGHPSLVEWSITEQARDVVMRMVDPMPRAAE